MKQIFDGGTVSGPQTTSLGSSTHVNHLEPTNILNRPVGGSHEQFLMDNKVFNFAQVMNLPRLAKYYAELRITDELEHVRLLRGPPP